MCTDCLNVETCLCPLVDCPRPKYLCHALFLTLVALEPMCPHDPEYHTWIKPEGEFEFCSASPCYTSGPRDRGPELGIQETLQEVSSSPPLPPPTPPLLLHQHRIILHQGTQSCSVAIYQNLSRSQMIIKILIVLKYVQKESGGGGEPSSFLF